MLGEGKPVETVSAEDVIADWGITLADMLESIREDLELSKTKMAEKLGMSRGHYGNIVNAKDPVSPRKAAEWARALGYPELVFIQQAIQDLLARSNLGEYKVDLKKRA